MKFSAGLMVGWASPSLPKLSSPESVPQLTPDEGFMVGNALNIGYIVAIPIVALTADIIGRRNGILLCAPTILLSWFLVAYVETFGKFFSFLFYCSIHLRNILQTDF